MTTIIVSSRDGAPVPRVAGAAKLVKLAEAAGWTVRQTYALASVPERRHGNGNVAKPAHALESVAVRLARGSKRGYALWTNENGHGWRFTSAYVGAQRHGARSIAERVTVSVPDHGKETGMTMDERCIHELIVDQCDLCRPRRAAPSPFDEMAEHVGPWFRAAYPGECEGCGERFDAGEYIRYGAESGYIGGCCAEELGL